MPAEKPAGAADSVVGKNSTPSNFFYSKIWFSDRLLLLVSAIFLLILILFFGLSPLGKKAIKNIFNQTSSEKIGLNSSNIFKNSYDKEKFDQFIASNQLSKAFLFLSSVYDQSPSDDKRKALIKLADYIKSQFPDEAKDTDLTVPCREESCGAIYKYTDDLAYLKKNIEESAIDQPLKKVLEQNVENAAIAASEKNKSSGFNSLLSLFYSLRAEWQSNKKIEVKNLAQQTLSALEKIDKQLYDFSSKKGLLNL